MFSNNYGSGMLMLIVTAGISVILLGFAVWYAWSGEVEKAKQEDICKRFCESLSPYGFSYDKVGYDDIRKDYVCYCKRTQSIIYNNTTYAITYSIPYGHIYNISAIYESNSTS